ncbi:hypothetical protein BpHYR1_023909 [Brachionus plicatilis]|uniref:Uncharacterized protein n=1 Tax=Brachionus plicatilis TaxID=10195 RepID=A0A3M7R5V9_BRAPC|nr:hypothetical protein BpHYR1_023909 [Brachionus plicatilis]
MSQIENENQCSIIYDMSQIENENQCSIIYDMSLLPGFRLYINIFKNQQNLDMNLEHLIFVHCSVPQSLTLRKKC